MTFTTFETPAPPGNVNLSTHKKTDTAKIELKYFDLEDETHLTRARDLVHDALAQAIKEGLHRGLTTCAVQSALALLPASANANSHEQLKDSSALLLSSKLDVSTCLLLPRTTFSVELSHSRSVQTYSYSYSGKTQYRMTHDLSAMLWASIEVTRPTDPSSGPWTSRPAILIRFNKREQDETDSVLLLKKDVAQWGKQHLSAKSDLGAQIHSDLEAGRWQEAGESLAKNFEENFTADALNSKESYDGFGNASSLGDMAWWRVSYQILKGKFPNYTCAWTFSPTGEVQAQYGNYGPEPVHRDGSTEATIP